MRGVDAGLRSVFRNCTLFSPPTNTRATIQFNKVKKLKAKGGKLTETAENELSQIAEKAQKVFVLVRKLTNNREPSPHRDDTYGSTGGPAFSTRGTSSGLRGGSKCETTAEISRGKCRR